MTQAATDQLDDRTAAAGGSGRLLHLGSRLALPLPHGGSPFSPRDTEPTRPY